MYKVQAWSRGRSLISPCVFMNIATTDRYMLDTVRRRLLRNGEPVSLGDRAFDLLLALAGGEGLPVPADDLTARVWPGVTVSAGNLRVQIRTLRRALGDDAVENVPGVGYRLTLSLTPAGIAGPVSSVLAEEVLVGREQELARLEDLLGRSRLVTIIGPGGVGKTCLARAAADRCEGLRVVHVELAPVRQAGLVPVVTAAALSIPLLTTDVIGAIQKALADQPALLVLDNAEHLLDEVGEFADSLLGTCPDLRLLLTSREPLNISGEQLLHLCPLSVPPEEEVSPAVIRTFAAVALVLRNHQRAGWPALADAEMPALARLCRQLDGLPLALVLLAARLRDCSVADVTQALADRLHLPLPLGDAYRHDSLAHMLDWSFDILSGEEKLLLSRLAIFAGTWQLPAAMEVCGEAPLSPAIIPALVANLVARSLVAGPVQTQNPGLRMLETIRQYVVARDPDLLRREGLYARLVRRVGHDAQSYYWQVQRLGLSKAGLESDFADLRTALDWALGGGDIRAGQALVPDVLQPFNREGLYAESAKYLTQAWLACDATTPPVLRAMLGLALHGEGVPIRLPYHAHRLDYARDELWGAVAALESGQDYPGYWLARGLINAGWVLRYTGDPVQAQILWVRAAAVAEAAGSYNDQSTILSLIGWAAGCDGDMETARRSFDQSLEIAGRIGLQGNLTLLRYADAEFTNGFTDRAIAMAQEAIKDMAGLQPALRQTLSANLASYLLLNDRLEEAVPHALQALRVLIRHQYTHAFAWTFERGALIAARSGEMVFARQLMMLGEEHLVRDHRDRTGPEKMVHQRLVAALGTDHAGVPMLTQEEALERLVLLLEMGQTAAPVAG